MPTDPIGFKHAVSYFNNKSLSWRVKTLCGGFKHGRQSSAACTMGARNTGWPGTGGGADGCAWHRAGIHRCRGPGSQSSSITRFAVYRACSARHARAGRPLHRFFPVAFATGPAGQNGPPGFWPIRGYRQNPTGIGPPVFAASRMWEPGGHRRSAEWLALPQSASHRSFCDGGTARRCGRWRIPPATR